MRVFRSTADQARRPGLITYAPVRSWASELGVQVLVKICCLTSESPSSTPHPQINVELSRLCKTGACIKKTKRCIKKTFSYFSTFQRWPPPQLHMAGHKNRATKTIEKQFTTRWQLSLLAHKTHQKHPPPRTPKSMLNFQDFARPARASKQAKDASKNFFVLQHCPAMASTPTSYGWP